MRDIWVLLSFPWTICCKWSPFHYGEEVKGEELGSPVPRECIPVVVECHGEGGGERGEVGAEEVHRVRGEVLVLVVEALMLEGSQQKVLV